MNRLKKCFTYEDALRIISFRNFWSWVWRSSKQGWWALPGVSKQYPKQLELQAFYSRSNTEPFSGSLLKILKRLKWALYFFYNMQLFSF